MTNAKHNSVKEENRPLSDRAKRSDIENYSEARKKR